MAATELGSARWWEIRSAQNRKPATYRCPLCAGQLPALSEHMLMLPEGRPTGRRHAHIGCVLAARRAGRLPTHAEWRAGEHGARPLSAWRRVVLWLTRGRPTAGR